MSADLVEKELNFFGIMRQDKTRAASSEDAVVVTGNSTQQKLFQMLTEPYSSTYAKVSDMNLQFLLVLLYFPCNDMPQLLYLP